MDVWKELKIDDYRWFVPPAGLANSTRSRPKKKIHTGAGCVKDHQSEANAGKKWVDEGSRTGEALLLCFEPQN